ncbi:MAG: cobyrinic acid a,c-diamide synthase [Actinomycetota bacterium]|nr:cobyrinic acid a,c-diamide synthase [Actinomycetota bacterium]
MSRRARLPGAEELFRRTGPGPEQEVAGATEQVQVDLSTKIQDDLSTSGGAPTRPASAKAPKHDEKITFYCTGDDLMALERARLSLRSEHGVGSDRGRIVRAALAHVLEDYEARGKDSILLRALRP